MGVGSASWAAWVHALLMLAIGHSWLFIAGGLGMVATTYVAAYFFVTAIIKNPAVDTFEIRTLFLSIKSQSSDGSRTTQRQKRPERKKGKPSVKNEIDNSES
jgi:hypothetical protein